MSYVLDDAFNVLKGAVDDLKPICERIARGTVTDSMQGEATEILMIYEQCQQFMDTLVVQANRTGETELASRMEALYTQLQTLRDRASALSGHITDTVDSEDELGIDNSPVSIICRRCATATPANELFLCKPCLLEDVSIGDDIPKQLSIVNCRHCQRWQKAANIWVTADLESQELMAMLLKKIKGLNKVKIQECKYVWCEPNSRRVKLSILIQSSCSGIPLEKGILVTFTVLQSACPECERHFTPHSWKSIVTLRQECNNKRTLRQLEQVIRQNDMQNKVIGVETHKDGFDLAFNRETDAEAFIKFIKKHFIVKHNVSEQLISHDANNNSANKKICHSVKIAPVSRGDLICIPKEYLKYYGNIPQLMVVARVTTSITLMDPFTLRALDVSAIKYWKYPFLIVATEGHLTRFVVLDVEQLPLSKQTTSQTRPRYIEGGRGTGRTTKESKAISIATSRFKPEELSFSRYQLVDLEIAKESDLGVNDERTFVTCHLGLHVKPGDIVVGYDLQVANVSGSVEDEMETVLEKSPSKVFLVRIAERAKCDGITGPHNSMSSKFRTTKGQMKQNDNIADDCGSLEVDSDKDLQELVSGFVDKLVM